MPPENKTPQTEFQNQEVNPPKNKAPLIIGLIVLVAVALVVGGYFVFSGFGEREERMEEIEELEELEVQEELEELDGLDTSDWQTYRNEDLGFKFKYPKEWKIVRVPTELERWKGTVKEHTLEIVGENIGLSVVTDAPGWGPPDPEIRYELGLDNQGGIFIKDRRVFIEDRAGTLFTGESVFGLGGISSDDHDYSFFFSFKRGSNDEQIIKDILSTFKFLE